jgi:hypothetical protein
MLLPLEGNAILMMEPRPEAGLKAAKSVPAQISVNLDSNKYILVDDFSYHSHRPYDHLWRDRSVYINRSFPVHPVTVGVATFDGLDAQGYPYNFITPTSYGACDTLTSLPIQLSKVDLSKHDPIYLTFYYQPQGIYPFSNSSGDSLTLQFFQKNRFDTVLVTDTGGVVIDTIIDTVNINSWQRMWGSAGFNIYDGDTTCNFAFREKTLKVPEHFYQDSFQMRFVSFGNTSGNVDVWHLDFVVLRSAKNALAELGDYAFRANIGSMIEEYESMPWYHYVGHETEFDRTRRARYKLRNTFSSNVDVDLSYKAANAQGTTIDSITTIAATSIFAKACKQETMPVSGDPEHKFKFPASSAPVNSTTYFLKKAILKRRIGSVDLIALNNQVDEFQIFGTYYAYDDGSAEAGYGVKSDKGKVAIQITMPDGVNDTLTSVYFHFNPVIYDRSAERFRLSVWEDNGGEPGDLIYENSSISTPTYPKEGVNYFQRLWLDQPLVISGTFYVGYQKITEDVLNIGYDLNREKNDKLFYSIGGAWIKSSTGTLAKGALMIRPSFRHLEEPLTGVKTVSKKTDQTLKLYPNPVKGSLNVSLNEYSDKPWNAQVFSMDGRLMHSFTFTGNSSMDVSNFPPGMYILNLTETSEGQSLYGKFLVIP